jgi:V-type H+-transporting ATPase subunit F
VKISTGSYEYFSLPDTAVSEVEDCFKRFVKRDDIDIILISQNCAELIRHVIDAHSSPIPAVLEIPSKGM